MPLTSVLTTEYMLHPNGLNGSPDNVYHQSTRDSRPKGTYHNSRPAFDDGIEADGGHVHTYTNASGYALESDEVRSILMYMLACIHLDVLFRMMVQGIYICMCRITTLRFQRYSALSIELCPSEMYF